MLFLLFPTHPPWRKADFCRFFSFSHGGKLIFTIFSISSTDDGRFSAFFAFRRPTTSVFRRFSRFVDRRRVFFSVFSVSSTDDECFSAISVFRRPTTSVFQRFSRFVDRRRVFFGVFCISSTDDGRFFCVFWFSLELNSRFLNRIRVVNPCFRNTHFMEKASDINVYRGLSHTVSITKAICLFLMLGFNLSLGQDEQRVL